MSSCFWHWPLRDSVTFTLDPDDVNPEQSVKWLQRHTGHFWVFVLYEQERKENTITKQPPQKNILMRLFDMEAQIKNECHVRFQVVKDLKKKKKNGYSFVIN